MNPSPGRLARFSLLALAACWAGTASAHVLQTATAAVDCENDSVEVDFFADAMENVNAGGPWSIEYSLDVQTNGATQTFTGSLREGLFECIPGTRPCTITANLTIADVPLTGDVIVGGSAELWQAAPGEPGAELWDNEPITNAGGQSPFTTICEVTGVDSDGDGVQDSEDNCIAVVNPDQRDTDGDGLGNICDTDLDNNCKVNFLDLGLFKSVIFSDNPDADFNGDGGVNFLDLGTLKAQFFADFTIDNPSGSPNACAD